MSREKSRSRGTRVDRRATSVEGTFQSYGTSTIHMEEGLEIDTKRQDDIGNDNEERDEVAELDRGAAPGSRYVVDNGGSGFLDTSHGHSTSKIAFVVSTSGTTEQEGIGIHVSRASQDDIANSIPELTPAPSPIARGNEATPVRRTAASDGFGPVPSPSLGSSGVSDVIHQRRRGSGNDTHARLPPVFRPKESEDSRERQRPPMPKTVARAGAHTLAESSSSERTESRTAVEDQRGAREDSDEEYEGTDGGGTGPSTKPGTTVSKRLPPIPSEKGMDVSRMDGTTSPVVPPLRLAQKGIFSPHLQSRSSRRHAMQSPVQSRRSGGSMTNRAPMTPGASEASMLHMLVGNVSQSENILPELRANLSVEMLAPTPEVPPLQVPLSSARATGAVSARSVLLPAESSARGMVLPNSPSGAFALLAAEQSPEQELALVASILGEACVTVDLNGLISHQRWVSLGNESCQ